MQLDRTHVVIRRRTLPEIGDLALVMLRRYPSALTVGFMIGVFPWLIANWILIGWIPLEEAKYGLGDDEAMAEIWRYIAWMAVLVVLQTPLAGAATTLYLGQAVFEQKPPWSFVFKQLKKQVGGLLWTLGIKRLAIPAMVICAFRFGQAANWFWDMVVPGGLMLTIAFIRSNRPFLPEILVLEQCPIRASGAENAITVARRSKSLHQPMASDLGGRYMSVSFVLFWLFLSVLYTFVFCRGITLGMWNWDLVFLLGMIPIALWVVAGTSVIIRLLNYLDTRIRLEGWEVELAVRAEAIRQFGEELPLAHKAIPDTTSTHDEPKLEGVTDNPIRQDESATATGVRS